MRQRTCLFISVLFSALLAGGCASRSSDASADAAYKPIPGEMDIAGKATDEKDPLRLVAHGINKQLSYKASEPGTLYVYDFDNNRFVYVGPLNAGEQFVLEPASNRATVNKQPVPLVHDTNDRDQYRVYFSRQQANG